MTNSEDNEQQYHSWKIIETKASVMIPCIVRRNFKISSHKQSLATELCDFMAM